MKRRFSRASLHEVLAVLTISAAIAAVLQPAHGADEVAAAAMSGRPLSTAEVESLFNDFTWRWKDGAGYFRANNDFLAWTRTEAVTNYAEGTWSVTKPGRLCFNATWYSPKVSKDARTCFEHRTTEKIIYQRKLPNGDWYIFSHIPGQPDDEAQNLKKGDQISKDYRVSKEQVLQSRPSRRRRR